MYCIDQCGSLRVAFNSDCKVETLVPVPLPLPHPPLWLHPSSLRSLLAAGHVHVSCESASQCVVVRLRACRYERRLRS